MDLTAFALDDLTFPLTTETPAFALDGFQWDAPTLDFPPAEAVDARDCGRTLAAGAGGATVAAGDCGRTLVADRSTWAGLWAIKVGEKRRLAIDFKNLDELTADGGETLTGTPTVTMVGPGSGLDITSAAVDGTKGAFWCDALNGVVAPADQLSADPEKGYTDYELKVAVITSGGATLVRSATVRIEE